MSGTAIMQASPLGAPASSSSPTPHIEVDRLELYYGNVPAVRGVSFNVLLGEQLTLLGPSGCGKTTTLRAIAGLEQPTAGEIRIDGVPVYSSERGIHIRAEKRGLSMDENARLFALLNVALADAGICCWECKFKCDLWRPVTAIHKAKELKTEKLSADAEWTPLLNTPPFPSYVSGHSTFSGAAAGALAKFFGTDEVSFSTTSDALPGVVRSFKSFSDAAAEAGMSRIYGGIHYDFDNTDGLKVGREIGEYVAANHFKPMTANRQ